MKTSSEDIQLTLFKGRNGQTEVRITIHRTDNVSVLIACSHSPIFADINEVMRLSNDLTRAEDYILKELDAGAKAAEKEFEPYMPDHMTWTCTHFHLGRDSMKEYNGERFNVTYENFQGAFVRVYCKAFRDGKKRLRVERLESPNRPLDDDLNNLLDGKDDLT